MHIKGLDTEILNYKNFWSKKFDEILLVQEINFSYIKI